MFDFQKLGVYSKAKSLAFDLYQFTLLSELSPTVKDQLQRASLSIMLNIAEGSSRFSNKGRRNFMIIARGSAIECAAIIDFLITIGVISEILAQEYSERLEEVSKMLFGMIKRFEP